MVTSMKMKTAISALVLGAAALSVNAQVAEFKPAGKVGDWSDLGSWTNDPATASQSHVRGYNTANVTTEASAKALLIGCDPNVNSTGTVRIFYDGTLTVSEGFQMGGRYNSSTLHSIGTGNLIIDGGSFVADGMNAANFKLGAYTGSTANIDIYDGSFSANLSGDAAFGTSDCTSNLTQAGGTSYFGSSTGTATFQMTSAKITGGTFNLTGAKSATFASKSLEVSGGTVKSDSSTAYVQDNMDVSDGVVDFSSQTYVYVGFADGSNTNITLSGGTMKLGGANTKVVGFGGNRSAAVSSDVSFTQTGGTLVFACTDSFVAGNCFSLNSTTNADNASKVTLKFLGGKVEATGPNGFYFGANAAGSKSSTLVVFGKDVDFNISSGLTWRRNANIQFNLDGVKMTSLTDSNFSAKSFGNVYFGSGDDFANSHFIVDASGFGAQDALEKGDVVSIALFVVSNVLDSAKVESLLSFCEIKGLDTNFWENASLSFSDKTLYFNGTYVPEPSTYAAIFGAVALALAVWRRRK